jgi:hypothetical protein
MPAAAAVMMAAAVTEAGIESAVLSEKHIRAYR